MSTWRWSKWGHCNPSSQVPSKCRHHLLTTLMLTPPTGSQWLLPYHKAKDQVQDWSRWQWRCGYQLVVLFIPLHWLLTSPAGPGVELGGLYDPSLLPDFDPKLFGLVFTKLAQQEVFTKDGALVPPWEMKDSLCPGTLVVIKAALIVYHFCGASPSTVCTSILLFDIHSYGSNRFSRSKPRGSRSWRILHWKLNLPPHLLFQQVLQRGHHQNFSLHLHRSLILFLPPLPTLLPPPPTPLPWPKNLRHPNLALPNDGNKWSATTIYISVTLCIVPSPLCSPQVIEPVSFWWKRVCLYYCY